MKTKTITVYEFNELSDTAKKKALESLCDLNVYHGWWEFIYEDATRIGLSITGFDLDRNRYATGTFLEDAEEVVRLIRKEHPEDSETRKTAEQFYVDKSKLVEKYSDGVDKNVVAEGNEFDFDADCDALEVEFLKSLLEDYSLILQREYDYQTSEAQIIEAIEANEYTFTEDGEMFN